MVWQVKQLLDEHGIPCFIKNEFASGAMGELSPLDVQPEVWIIDEEWLPRVRQLIDEWGAQQNSQPEWRCNECKELNDGSFETCWQCSAVRPSLASQTP